jgi:hypothetical protein
VFIVLSHNRRQVVHFNATEHPTAQWPVQQLVEAFPFDNAPRYLQRDRDAIYWKKVRRRIKSLGIEEVVSAPRSPWQHPYVERVIGSIRRDCLDYVIVVKMWLALLLVTFVQFTIHGYFGKKHDSRIRPESIRGAS